MLEEAKKNNKTSKKTKEEIEKEKFKEFMKTYPVVVNPDDTLNRGYTNTDLGMDQNYPGVPKDMSFSESFVKRVIVEYARGKDDPDLPGYQKKEYYEGLTKKQKEARQRQFKRQTKKPPDEAKPAPGDEKDTELSKHTKKYHEMYPAEAFEVAEKILLGEGLYGSFAIDPKANAEQKALAYNMISLASMASLIATRALSEPNFAKTHGSSMNMFRDCLNRAINIVSQDPGVIMKIRNNVNSGRMFTAEDFNLNESAETALKKKAEKSGISYSILRKVYDRGLAAWRTGHRPGATPQQWGYARVNSFITGGKTRSTADKDLWKRHSSKKKS